MNKIKTISKITCLIFSAAILAAAVSSCSGTKKDVPQEFIDSFESADQWIAAAAVVDEVDSFYVRDVLNALETLMMQVNMYEDTQTVTKDKVGLSRIYTDLSVLFADVQNMGDNPNTEQLRDFHKDWIKLRDRFEPYIPAARKKPPVYTPSE